jgi:septum formation protein
MSENIILASGSEIRRMLLTQAGIYHSHQVARVDEQAIRASLEAELVGPRDIADALAEAKARRISGREPDSLVIGCDQVLEFKGKIHEKPASPIDAVKQLQLFSGAKHRLLSAAVIYRAGAPVWRHVGVVRMHMRVLSDDYINDYVSRNWDTIKESVGCYKLEEEGSRLFSRVEGDYFTVLGLPLLEITGYLIERGALSI